MAKIALPNATELVEAGAGQYVAGTEVGADPGFMGYPRDLRLVRSSPAVGIAVAAGDPGDAGAWPYGASAACVPFDIVRQGTGKLDAIKAYIVARIKAAVGHNRVYRRGRLVREELRFINLFSDGSVIDFWEVRRGNTPEELAGTGHSSERDHAIDIVYLRGLVDQDGNTLDAGDTEREADIQLELVSDDLRGDRSLGYLVEHAELANTRLDVAVCAGRECHEGTITLQVQEFLSQ